MSKKAKAKEDDDLRRVQQALKAFHPEAEFAKYKMDVEIRRYLSDPTHLVLSTANQRRLSQIRGQIRNAANRALQSRTHTAIIHPRLKAETMDFLAALKKVQEANRTIQLFDVEAAFSILGRRVVDGDEGETSPEDVAEHIDYDVNEIQEKCSTATACVNAFLDRMYIPRFEKTPSRTILFIRNFINELAENWWVLQGTQLVRDDLSQMTKLIVTALTDFKYPFSQAQLKSDVWLSDRIRHQLFRN
jgi:hypothetical protein